MSEQNRILFFLVFHLSLHNLLFGEEKDRETQDYELFYQEDFENIALGKLPDDFFILDGDFSVVNMEGRKCLELSAQPVGEHGFLFGPRLKFGSFELSFSCLGGSRSRRHNMVAGNLGGVRGFKYQLNPSRQEVLFTFQKDWQHGQGIEWSSLNWMQVKVQVDTDPKKMASKIRMLVQKEAKMESIKQVSWISLDDVIAGGKCMLWGYCYADFPVYWDNLIIRSKN